jgi:hypothetical protein
VITVDSDLRYALAELSTSARAADALKTAAQRYGRWRSATADWAARMVAADLRKVVNNG